MNKWVYAVLAVSALINLFLTVRVIILRRSIAEICEEFEEKLRTDTNTPILVTAADRKVRALASRINSELASLRREKRRLDAGNNELTTAVTNISHDLRTPLTAISGYLELLENISLEPDAERYVGIIRERTENLKALTEELFSYSVLRSSGDMEFEDVTLNRELEIALAAEYESFIQRGIEPKIEICDENVVRRLHSGALQRVFGNILSNAVKYAEDEVTVKLCADGSIEFSNPAPSLSEIEVGRLFDRFYTVENAKGSTGLGLSIARMLTEKMGGTIGAEYTDGRLRVKAEF